MSEHTDNNGKMEPCWLTYDCQLAQDQREGNKILSSILSELVTLNTHLVKPATSANRVPTCVLAWVIIAFVTLLVVQKVVDSGYNATATGGGTNISVTQGQKKTPQNESQQQSN